MISPSDGPNEQLSDDGRWRWDGERWHPVLDREPPRRPEPLPPAPLREERPPAPVAEPLDASAFTGERMLRGRAVKPSRGWRRSVYIASGGLVNPGLSQAEQAERALTARCKMPVAGCRRVV